MNLEWSKVDAIIKDVLLTDTEVEAWGVRAASSDMNVLQGILDEHGVLLVHSAFQRIAMVRERLEKHRATITAMVQDLDPGFMRDGGDGGRSMIELPFTRGGAQWGEQWQADFFFALAKGLGIAGFCIEDREAWDAMPGGMPYVWFQV